MTGDGELVLLFEEVQRARIALRAERGNRTERHPSLAARHQMVAALEAYVGALHQRHFPVPPVVQTELRLLRTLPGYGR